MTISTVAAADAGATIGEALSDLTGILHIPVLIVAIGMLALTAYETGRLATEAWRRFSRRQHSLRAAARRAAERSAGDAAALRRDAPSAAAGAALIALATEGGDPNHALADYEHAVQRRLDRTRLLVRSGPAVGLMGTLIPLAPGLTALGEGDVPGLAADLRIAFAATVIGILTGTVAFALTLIRTRLYSEDLTALERGIEDHAGA